MDTTETTETKTKIKLETTEIIETTADTATTTIKPTDTTAETNRYNRRDNCTSLSEKLT